MRVPGPIRYRINGLCCAIGHGTQARAGPRFEGLGRGVYPQILWTVAASRVELAEAGQRVRGIIICRSMSEDLRAGSGGLIGSQARSRPCDTADVALAPSPVRWLKDLGSAHGTACRRSLRWGAARGPSSPFRTGGFRCTRSSCAWLEAGVGSRPQRHPAGAGPRCRAALAPRGRPKAYPRRAMLGTPDRRRPGGPARPYDLARPGLRAVLAARIGRAAHDVPGAARACVASRRVVRPSHGAAASLNSLPTWQGSPSPAPTPRVCTAGCSPGR